MIYSDSQAAIKSLFADTINSRIVGETVELYKNANNIHKVQIRWIKGHANHTGNELADMLAKKGAYCRMQGCTPFCSTTIREVKTNLKKRTDVIWQKLWNKDSKNKHTVCVFELFARLAKSKTIKHIKSLYIFFI